MAEHRADIRAVVQRVQGTLGLPYEMLGHSYGAASALDYASHFSAELVRVIALDIYAFDPGSDPQAIDRAEATYSAHVALLSQGVYVDPAGAQAGVFARLTPEEHLADSGSSRESFGAPGNFTNDGLTYISLIYNSQLPGIHSELTGLAGDWPLRQSVFAGTYTFAPDPLDDVFAFTYVERSTLIASSAAARSGLIPMAFARDYWAAVAGDPAYAIDWASIKTKLVWLNAELGYGTQTYGASAAAASGNPNVEVAVIPGYGHGDMLLSRSARRDVWSRLLRGTPKNR
jgi:pimeloyl-ACP methyl ester carboxylesterase